MATIDITRTRFATAVAADPAEQAFWILRAGFVLAPILFGLDKFFNLTVDWPTYLAPWLDRLVPGDAQAFMVVVGAVEIAAGILVAVRPDVGGLVVAAWLGGIVVNILTVDPPRFYDVALRDVGLALGALALSRLAVAARRRATR
ncbi:MAG TPA: hypothetical protein VF044_09650 [Actinomycetota bacterium]